MYPLKILSEHQNRQLEAMLQRVRNVARLRHMAWSTEKCYCTWIAKYAEFIAVRRMQGEARDKVEAFLTWMALEGYSAVSQNQAFCALLFFYRDCQGIELKNVDALRARRPKRQPFSPTFDEVQRLLADVQDSGGYPLRLMIRLIYGSGLRLGDACQLRVKDVCLSDPTAPHLTLRQGKGAKDRTVPLPKSILSQLQIQLAAAAAVADRDRLAKMPIQLPGRLGIKYPRLEFSKDWAFVFPGRNPCADPRTGRKVRWHCLEENVQRAVRASVRRLGLNDMIHTHSLRHAFATHALDRGANIRDLQVILGHNSLETTQVYVHPEVGRVKSPLDEMSIAM